MVRSALSLPLAALCILPLGGSLTAFEGKDKPRDLILGSLRAPEEADAKAQALAWLKKSGKADDLRAFERIWQEDRPLLDRVAATLCLGNPDAAKLLDDAQNPNSSAPTAVAEFFTDRTKDTYLRSNLALAVAKALSARRIYEEAVATLQAIKPEDVVDPAGYFFTRAIAEHALMKKPQAEESIRRLLEDVADTPERYQIVAAMLLADMESWKSKDLDAVARIMDNVSRRLELARGGKETQRLQRDVIYRLDELIKQHETDGPHTPGGPGGNNPPEPGDSQPSQGPKPLDDSRPGGQSGPGEVFKAKERKLFEAWGKLPDRDRIQALVELTRELPPRYREMIETYYRRISKESTDR